MLSKIMFHINSLGKGGAERVVSNLSDKFAKKGIDVIIATEWTAGDEYELNEDVRRIDVGLTEDEEQLSRMKKLKLREKKLHDLYLTEKPDVVISFTRNSNYRAVLASKNTNIPVIFSVRSDPNTDYGSFIHRFLGNKLYKKSAGGVFQTEDAKAFFHKDIQDKSVVLLNPLNEKYVGISKSSQRRKAIVTAGRFNVAKDHLTLIKAAERVFEKHPDYVLEMYGDRSEDNTFDVVKKYVEDHGLTEKVKFMGNSNSLDKDIADASVFVLSSIYEGMPNALMEAMAMGIPVVSTDCPCGGPKTIVQDGKNGFLVPVKADDKMAEAICKYIENSEMAEDMAMEAMKMQETASPELITDMWLSYIENRVNDIRKK